MDKTVMSPRMTMAAMLAVTLGSMARFPGMLPTRAAPKPRKRVPTMVTASPEEIAAWNAAVEAKRPRAINAGADKQQRKALIAKIGRRQYLRQIKQYRRDLSDYAAQHRPEWADA